HSGTKLGARIGLRKRIPLQAGLGGGSSDAATVLIGLNRLWNLGLTSEELARIGAEVGSDVSFFFSAPWAWCTGRGENVEALKLGRQLDLVLASPAMGLSTATVFGRVVVPVEPKSGAAMRAAVNDGDVEEIGRCLFNRLQAPAEGLCPEVKE